MSIDHQRLVYLLTQYAENKIGPDDLEELIGYVHAPTASTILLEAIEETGNNFKPLRTSPEDKDRIYQNIINSKKFKPAPHSIIRKVFDVKAYRWLSMAAMCIMCFASFYFFYRSQKNSNSGSVKTNQIALIASKIDMGHNKAVLTLSNGSKVLLAKGRSGVIAVQGNTSVKQEQGLIKYDKTMGDNVTRTIYNTVTTPKGSNFQLVLADGTKVWLNTNTSITYPIAFNGNTREVSVTGEAYFEVFHDATKPFIVKSELAQIAVLGTHFNVNAYPKAKMITTLLSGSVKVSATTGNIIIKPNQEALVVNDKSQIEVRNVDANDATTWRNGYFLFHNQNIKDVMQTVARWYDVDIEYKGEMKGKTFGGTIARFENIEKLLKSIELTGVIHFKIEGRRVIVMP